MHSRRPPAQVLPKISTLPQRRSAATVHLERYKLTIEQTRLQKELQDLSERQRQLQRRLSQLNRQLSELSNTALSASSPQPPTGLTDELSHPAPTSCVYLPSRQAATPEDYSTLMLEY